MGTTLRTAIGLAAIVSLAVVHGDAQSQQKPATAQQAQPPQQPPSFKTNINFVRVDVIITDKAGNPVWGETLSSNQ